MNPNQTPTKWSDVSGELIVARSPATAKPPSLPDEVVAAAENPLQRVRAVAVDALRDLALRGDATGALAYARLREMLDDDSRTVIAKAGAAIAEIDRTVPGRSSPSRPQPTSTTASGPSPEPYSGIRYGSEEIPPEDVPFNVYVATWFVVPLALRALCLYQLIRKGTARIKPIGTLAQRLAYGRSVPTGRR